MRTRVLADKNTDVVTGHVPEDENDFATPSVQKVEAAYDADSISKLEGLEAVRRRPGMYIGDTGTTGLHHLFKEIIDNSIDEVLAGYCSLIKVTLGKDRTITVEDNGRGIPVGINKDHNKPAVELAMTDLHAGGKFGGGGYKTSGGLHGVGASCVNALSDWMETTVRREGKVHQIRFERGNVTVPLKVIGTCDPVETGTTQKWLADASIFEIALTEEGELDYHTDRIASRIRELCFLNKEVTIVYVDEINDAEPLVFHYKRGIAEYVAYLNEARDSLHSKVVYFYREQNDTQVEIAIQYNKSYQENIYCFANNIPQSDGGTHLSGFKSALTRVINTYSRKNGLLKERDTNLSGDDVREGITAVISVRLTNPMFNSQDKRRLTNPEVEGLVNTLVGEGLSEFLEENPQVGRMIVEKALTAQKAREAARKAADLVKRQSAMDGGGLPGKLADCLERDPMKCELYIVEGDSAGGCFSGDTKIALADGRALSFLELIAEQAAGKTHACYTIKTDGTIGVGEILHPRCTKKKTPVVQITLDSGRKIVCTPDHQFMLRDGSYKAAAELVPSDSLMPLYQKQAAIGRQMLIGRRICTENQSAAYYNHRILSVESLLETTDVYDIEVPETNNFALESGVFVHNSAKQGRDRRTQAILPLFGKIICVEKARIDKALDNESVKMLITAIGTGLSIATSADEEKDRGSNFDLAKLRYGKVIIMTDADVDGDHIRTLLLNFFYRYMKPLVDHGYIFIAQPPLYAIRVGKDQKLYARTEAERDRILKEVKKKDVHITRFKGLGEMNPEDLADTTMNPQYRTLAQVTVEEAAEADQMFTVLLGEKVEPRRAFIERHAKEVKDIDVH
jgi:DNA gyrase subunit B